jgi:hypothetical protein
LLFSGRLDGCARMPAAIVWPGKHVTRYTVFST